MSTGGGIFGSDLRRPTRTFAWHRWRGAKLGVGHATHVKVLSTATYYTNLQPSAYCCLWSYIETAQFASQTAPSREHWSLPKMASQTPAVVMDK